jgi:RNA polymerase sigma factor (sigma-70 family)
MFLKTRNADAIVIAAVLSGDRNAFAALVGRYERVVQGMALSYGTGNVFAEDVAQETFLRAFKDLGRLRDANRFGPWLMQIARGVAIDYARKNARQQPLTDEAGETFEHDPATTELHRMLREEVSRLAPAFREIIVLHYFSGKSTREIADLLGLSKAAAQKRLQRARVDLGANLEKHLPGAFAERRPSAATVASVMAVIATAALPVRAQGAVAVTAGVVGSGLLVKGIALAVLLLLGTILGWFYFGPGSVPQSPPAVAVAKTPKTAATPAASTEARVESTPEAATVPAGAVPEDAEPTISGTVSDTQGKPVPGAKVVGYAPSGFRAEATTNKEGQYKLEWLAIAPYTLRVRAKGYWPGMLEEINVGSTNADFRLDQAPLIAGRVLRADTKAPVAGAKLSREGEEPVLTDEQGAFEFEVDSAEYVRANEEVVTVVAEGYLYQDLPISKYLQVEAGQYPEVLLEPMPTIEGLVVTADGAPVANAEIHAEQLRTTVESVPRNRRTAMRADENSTVRRTLLASRGGVRPTPPTEPRDEVVAHSNAEGVFRITSLLSWPDSLYASHKDYAPASAELGEASAPSPVKISLVMQPGATITGQVRFNGEPLTHADVNMDKANWLPSMFAAPVFFRVLARGESPSVPLQASVSLSDGKYRIEGVSPGETKVRLCFQQLDSSRMVLPIETPTGMTRKLSLRSGEEAKVDFDLRMAVLHGKVYDEAGRPASGYLSYSCSQNELSHVGNASINTDTGYSVFVPQNSEVTLRIRASLQESTLDLNPVVVIQIPAATDVLHDVVLPAGASITASLINWTPAQSDFLGLGGEFELKDRTRGAMGIYNLAPGDSGVRSFEPAYPGQYTFRLVQYMRPTDGGSELEEQLLAERTIEVTDAGDYSVEFDMSQIPLDPPASAE